MNFFQINHNPYPNTAINKEKRGVVSWSQYSD